MKHMSKNSGSHFPQSQVRLVSPFITSTEPGADSNVDNDVRN
jgi:hypothetical protein